MSEYIATARVQVLPDLDNFTKNLTTDLNNQIKEFNKTTASKLKPIQVPVAAGAISKTQMAGITSAANKANAALAQTSASTKAVNTNLDRFNKQGAKSRATLLGLGTASARLDSALLGLRTAIGSTAVIGLGAGALAAIALGKAIRSLITITTAYERELNTFQAVTGASANEMERVAAAAKELGADITLPAVSAADAAVAMSELAKAGLSVQDAIDGARGVLQLATAANINFAQATELAAAVLNAFQLAGKDAVEVADTLANAANAAQGSITDIGLALSQSSAIAEQAGVNYQDTAVFLTQLARAGLKGSDAGTSLRTALIRLINPTAKAAAIIADLGVQIRDAQGNIRSDVFLQFANAMRGMTAEQRDANLAIIGGQDALRAFAILGRASTRDFLALRAELRQQGTAAEVAAARTKGLGGAYQALQSTLETIGITIGQKVSPGLTDFVNSITASANALAQSEGVAAAFSGAMAGVATALNLVGAALGVVGPLLLGLVNITSKATFGFGSSLVTAILATVVALKAYNVAANLSIATTTRATAAAAIMASQGMVPLLTTNIATGAAIGSTATVLTRFQKVAIGTRAVLAGLLSSWNIWVIGITAAAAGFLYLISRESATEKATRQLKEATQGLADAQNAAKMAAQGLAGATRAADTAGLAVQQAKLARATAAAALASSNAARGSIERRQLEINLAVATQDVTFATKDAARAIEDLVAAQEASEAAALASAAAMKEEIKTLQILAIAADMEDAFTRPKEPTGFPLADLIFKATDKAGITDTTSALEVFNNKIREVATGYKISGDAALVWRGKQLDAITAVQTALGKKLTPVQWQRILATKDLQGLTTRLIALLEKSGVKGGSALLVGILQQAGLIPKRVGDAISKNAIDADRAAQAFGRNIGTVAGTAATAAFALSFDAEQAIAEASGASDAQLLALAQARLAKSKAFFERIKGEVASGKRPPDDPLLVAAAEEVNRRQAVVDSLLGNIESAAKDQQSKIKEAKDKKDQAAQDLFDLLTSKGPVRWMQRKIEAAALTPTVTDDIKYTKALITYFNNLKKTLYERLKKTGAAAKVIRQLMAAFSDILFNLNLDLAKLQKQNEENLAKASEALQSALMQKLDLKIQFFEIKGNIQGQIKAHRAKLKVIQAELRKLEKQKKTNTVAYWDLKVAEAEEQKAIQELTGQTKEKNKAQASLMFAFLQAQQGFAANLLGNLIPGGATAGLVGNTNASTAIFSTAGLEALRQTTAATSAEELIRQERAGILPQEHGRGRFGIAGDASKQAQISAGAGLTVTRGQGSTQIELLRKILRTLNDMKRGQGFPAAKNQGANSKTALDMGHGGSGGGGGMATA